MSFLNAYRYLFIGFCATLTFGFSSSGVGVSPEEYMRRYSQYEKNFSRVVLKDKYAYSIKYIPNEVRLIKLINRNEIELSSSLDFMKERNSYMEFIFQINIPEFSDEFLKYMEGESTYEDRLGYYAFEMQKDIQLLTEDGDLISCSNYVFERNFGMSPKGTMTIGFEFKNDNKNIRILFNNELVGHKIEFDFNGKEINSLPTLKNYKKWKK